MNKNIKTNIHWMIALSGKRKKRGDACTGSGWALKGHPLGIDIRRLLVVEASIRRVAY